jgi:hypothetical protein
MGNLEGKDHKKDLDQTKMCRVQTLTAELRLAEGQFSLEEQTINIEKSVIYRAGTRRWQFPKDIDRI